MRFLIKFFVIVFIVAGFGFLIHNFSSVVFPLPQPAEAQSQNTDWPQLQHDAQHTGWTPAFVPPNHKVTWAWLDKDHIVRNFISEPDKSITDGFEPGFTLTTKFAEFIQPIIANGLVFFGSMNGTLYAVDALTGDNRWEYATGGPILSTAAYANTVLVLTSIDGKVYGLNAVSGSKLWEYKTGAGINASPVIAGSTIYVGSRDGSFYALDVASGALRWKYTTQVEPVDSNSIFNGAPIVAPAAVSQDGSKVFFGAENMFFYALNTADGSVAWPPKKLIGQSFLFSWPVVAQDKVIIRTMSSLLGAEFLMEDVLDALPASPTWLEEKAAVSNWLLQNPHQKTMYVFDVNTGVEPYQVAMGRVTGVNFPPHPPVVDGQGRPLMYWRSKHATLFDDRGTFGSKYCSDISYMDIATGDRITINNPNSVKHTCPELDNGFQPTMGGDWLYMQNQFRGSKTVNVVTGEAKGLTGIAAYYDGGGWRENGAWGYQFVYYGNDSAGPTGPNPLPPSIYWQPAGFTGISIATTNNRTLLYITEAYMSGIVALEHQQ